MTGLETKLKKTKFRSDQDELKLRAAYLYYVEGRTQEQVAQHLGISRIKALRLLAATREDGTVQITINSPAGSLIKLQRELEEHLGLSEAIVVPTSDQNEESVAAVVGHGKGRKYLERRFRFLQQAWGARVEIVAALASSRTRLRLRTRARGANFCGCAKGMRSTRGACNLYNARRRCVLGL